MKMLSDSRPGETDENGENEGITWQVWKFISPSAPGVAMVTVVNVLTKQLQRCSKILWCCQVSSPPKLTNQRPAKLKGQNLQPDVAKTQSLTIEWMAQIKFSSKLKECWHFVWKKKTKTLNFSEKGKGKDVEWRNVMKAEVQGRKEEADIFRMGQPLENETNDLQ